MRGFTEQGKKVQESFEAFLVMKELTSNVRYEKQVNSAIKSNRVTLEMDHTPVYKMNIYMREVTKGIEHGIVEIQINRGEEKKVLNPLNASNLRILNQDRYNGLRIAFDNQKDFKKIFNILKKFL